MDGLFLKTKPMTREITLKNFKGRNKGLPDKTFDYMLLWDTKTYTGGICSWDACMKNTILKDDSVAFRVNFDDITFFAENVEDPILIITGRRDTQVRFQETVDMVNELKKYNKDYKYIIKGEEGHGFRRETARLELFQDYEEFLTKHLN